MKRSFVQIEGVLYEKGTEPRVEGPMVMGDIDPYRSMITGEQITSRSRHREHLRDHGCFEVGNEIPKHIEPKGIPDCAPQRRKEMIRAQIAALSHAEFKAAIRRDVQDIKWNSRKD